MTRSSLRAGKWIPNSNVLSIHSPKLKWSVTQENQLLKQIEINTIEINGVPKIAWKEVSAFFYPNKTLEAVKSKYKQIKKRNLPKIEKSGNRRSRNENYNRKDILFILINYKFYTAKALGELLQPQRSPSSVVSAYFRYCKKFEKGEIG
jgi:hypothetical protein